MIFYKFLPHEILTILYRHNPDGDSSVRIIRFAISYFLWANDFCNIHGDCTMKLLLPLLALLLVACAVPDCPKGQIEKEHGDYMPFATCWTQKEWIIDLDKRLNALENREDCFAATPQTKPNSTPIWTTMHFWPRV